ncbi:hypothetical protein HK104_005345, partial [Borealophlyctis nickersoniae]
MNYYSPPDPDYPRHGATAGRGGERFPYPVGGDEDDDDDDGYGPPSSLEEGGEDGGEGGEREYG